MIRSQLVQSSLLCSVLILFWLYGFHIPFNDYLLSLQIHVDNTFNEVVRARHDEQVNKQLLARSKELQVQFEAIKKDHQKISETQTEFLFEQTTKNKLQLKSFVREKDIVKDWYDKEVMRMTFVGDWKQLSNFFATLFESGRMIQCKHVELTYLDEKDYSCSCLLQCTKLK